MAETLVQELKSEMRALAGKYLTFRLAHEEYGVQITKVVEIIKMMEVTAVPRTPQYVRGVINLRGKVIPVVELRRKFDMPPIDDNDETCIIVINVQAGGATGAMAAGEVQMGILVDTVSEVLDIGGADIEPPPKFGGSIDTAFILGMAKAKGAVKILIDIDRVLSAGEVAKLAAM